MKKVLLLPLAVGVIACAPRHTATGHIDGLTNDTLIVTACALEEMPRLTDDSDERIISDTIVAVNGRFTYDMPVNRPTQFIVTPVQLMVSERGNRYTTYVSSMKFFLDKGEYATLKGRIDSTVFDCRVSGTRLNEDYSRHYRDLIPYWAEGERLQKAMAGKTRPEQEALYVQFQKTMDRRRACEMAYIDANPDNPVAGYSLHQIPADSIYTYYQRLNGHARNSIFQPLIEPLLFHAEKSHQSQLAEAHIKPGEPAPDFTLERTDGTNFTLSSLRGKYVVLDFWGSWCGWCVKGFPDMKTNYKRYKSNLEIIGIDCRDTREKWLAAVDEYGLPWINVYNPETSPAAEDVSVRYAVGAYPTKIIIDPAGRIVEKFSGENPGFYQKLAEVMK